MDRTIGGDREQGKIAGTARGDAGRARHRCDVHRIARQCGVRLRDGARCYRTARGAGECYSPATLRRIGRRHGAAHLALVLRLIVETEDNATALYGETLQAVSELLIHRPDLIERGTALFDDFDRIDLNALRGQARVMACGLPVSHVMRILILQKLSGPLSEQLSAAA